MKASAHSVYVLGRDEVPQQLRLGAGEQLKMTLVVPEGVSASLQMDIELAGEGAQLDLAGVYTCLGGERLSLDVNIRHSAPRCTSRQLFKGIVGGTARAAFHGLVYVAPGAAQTEARQESHALLLTPEAFVEAQPQLEIYADDVVCTHGATTGFLDPEAVFYLRSRGIGETQARMMLTEAFLAPVYARLHED
ncbi:MAG: SufD family Fe-S cluster assembly protein [Bacteroidales bacterium]|nr:SufD family Fe-S cluster assembly protein [Bacteroidales bacterium]